MRPAEAAPRSFRDAVSEVWSEPETRRFTLFVFLSMIAYSAQELIIEPFAGLVFQLTPGQTTQLAGVQHGGALCGMVIVEIFSGVIGKIRIGSLKGWAIGGCIGSAVALCLLAAGGLNGAPWPIHANVFALGVANGIYAIAAIASMMALVGSGRAKREGVRMGLHGAAQATAFGLGGLLGSLASDVARHLLDSASTGYAFVFVCEAALFVSSAALARRAAAARPFAHTVSLNSEVAR
jgi:BCD family chlorophyll transporter-like MFS transporter